MDSKQYNSDEIEIDLGEIFAILMGRIFFILFCAVLAGAAAFLVSKFLVTELYESSTSVYVLSKQNSETITYTDVQLGTQLTNDYPQLIKSRTVLDNVLMNSGIDMTAGQLAKKINVTTSNNTRILVITVTDESPERAQFLADEVRKEAAIRIKEITDIQAVNLVDSANLPTSPSSPNVIRWTLIGFLVGAFLSIAATIVRFMLDDTIKTSDDVERYLGMSTLGMIPLREDAETARKKSKKKKSKHSHSSTPTSNSSYKTDGINDSEEIVDIK